MTFLIVFIILLFIFCAVILYFFNLAFVRKSSASVDDMDSTLADALKPYEAVIAKGSKHIKETPHKWCYTTAFDGIKLAGRYYDNNSECTIFLFHGYRSSGAHDFSCAVEMYMKMGFNVFLADQRAHGKSEGELITFGVKESRDVISWVDFVNAEFSPKQVIISGLSMGATTVLLSLRFKLPENVRGVIADCGFTSPSDIIEKVGRDSFKVNAHFFIPFLDFACKLFGGFSIRNISTVDAVKNTDLPILFIHGEKDNFVPCEMSKRAYKECNANCRIFLSKEAGHGLSFLVDTDLVLSTLKEFLNFCIKDD